MKLSILIATLGHRDKQFIALVDHLAELIGDKPVEIVAYWNNGERSIGEIRQALLEAAKGEYICFIDDDDVVPEYYIDKIFQAIWNGPDYIGFKVELRNNGQLMPPAFHSIRYDKWSADGDGYYRNVTHLNPIKRELALLGKFAGYAGEDGNWSAQVYPHVRTENFIDLTMYYYMHNSLESFFTGNRGRAVYKRPGLIYPCFRYIGAKSENV